MKKITIQGRKQLMASLILLLTIAACKKTGTPVTTKTPITVSACKLTDETNNFNGNYEHYWYTYSQDGKLDSIYYAQTTVPGYYVAYCKEDPGGYVWYSYVGTDGKIPDLYDNEYDGSTQDSTNFPSTLQTSFQLFDGVNTTSYGFEFAYKSKGIFDGFQQTASFTTGLLIGMGVEYTDSGDISAMTYNVTTGPRASSYVTTKGFDGHPSPYTGISGWVFMSPQVVWTGSNYEPLLYALSPHNPISSAFQSGSDIWTDNMTYVYNTQGYPTSRTVTTTSPTGNTSSYTDTYTYSCH